MDRTKAEWAAQSEPTLAELVRGTVSAFDQDYAREKILHATRVAFGPVLRLELRLTQHDDPARVARSFVEMSAVIAGQPIRAHAAAPTIHEATDAAAQRFTQQIERAQDRREAMHQRLTDPSSWHHGDAARNHARRVGVYPRPNEARALVRRKPFALEGESIDEAVLDLELLDHDFFLFENVETGQPNVVAREGEGYRLWQVEPGAPLVHTVIAPVAFDPAVAPRCTVSEARLMLAMQEEEDGVRPPFVFFVDDETGRGAVLYRRFDGHDGLVEAAEEA